MLFHVELRTDDPEVIRALQGVKNRARFVSMALKHFLSTKQGRETLAVMLRQGPRVPGKKKASGHESGDVVNFDELLTGKTKREEEGPEKKQEKGGLNSDRFL